MKWIQFRHLLHECAEQSGEEWKTRACLIHELKHHKGQLIQCRNSCGLMMFYDFHAKTTVMIRAEMDGLCICEENEFSYVSKNKGVMHACGHDGHMTILCALSEVLSDMKQFSKNVLLVFQSSEETGAGALKILEEEAFQKICPDICCALHVMPQMKRGLYVRKGVMCAGSRELNLKATAESAHCALRKEDALMKTVHFLEKLSSVSCTDGFASFHVCHAGTVRNQGAQQCELLGTMRFLSCQAEKTLMDWLVKNCPEKGTLFFSSGYPVLMNHGSLSDCAVKCGCTILNEPLWISDDFAFYAQRMPSVYVLLGTDTQIPLHHSHFDFDDRCSERGVEFLMEFLKECQKE